MASTFYLIEAKTSTSTSLTFSSIPSTYTDLKLIISVRNNDVDAFDGLYLSFNSSTSNFTGRYLEGTGSGGQTSGSIARFVGVMNGAASTSNVFSSADIYISNYASSLPKSFGIESVSENNATLSFTELQAGLWNDTTAINSVTLAFTSGPFISGSTFYLYGIKNT
jgi:hypothetical protein